MAMHRVRTGNRPARLNVAVSTSDQLGVSWLGSLDDERAPTKAAAPAESSAAPVVPGVIVTTAAAPPPDDLLPGPPSAGTPDTAAPADPPVESVPAPNRSAAGGDDAAAAATPSDAIRAGDIGADIVRADEGSTNPESDEPEPDNHEHTDTAPSDAARTEGGHIPSTTQPRSGEPLRVDRHRETTPALHSTADADEPAPDDARAAANGEDLDRLHEVVGAAAREFDRTPFSPRLRGRLKAALAAEAEALEARGFASYGDYVATGEERTSSAAPIDATAAGDSATPRAGETERLASQLAEARNEIRRAQRQHTEALGTAATEREGWERTHLDIIRTLRQDLAATRRQAETSREERGAEQDELDDLRARAERDLEQSREVAQRDAAAVAEQAARDVETMRAAAEHDVIQIRETAEQAGRVTEESARRAASEIEDQARNEAEAIRAEAEVTVEGLRQLADHSEQAPPAAGGSADAPGGEPSGEAPDADASLLTRRGELALEWERLSAELATMAEARDSAELDLASLDDRVERQRAKRRRIRTEVSRRREQFRREREAVDQALVASRHEATATAERARAEAAELTEAADARAQAITEEAEAAAQSLAEAAATERDRMLEAATQLADATLERARVAMTRARTDLTALEPRVGRVADDAALLRDQVTDALKALDPPDPQ